MQTTEEVDDDSEKRIGFTVDGRIEIYVTEPDQPPGEKPHSYDIRFTPYDENA
ncbi:MAG TPA: hypothetical protein VI479_11595 [Blastocatellia bacterium]